MTHRLLPFLALVAAVPGAAQDAGPPPAPVPMPVPVPGEQLAQLSIHERIVIRIPRMPLDAPPPRAPVGDAPTRWVEKRGERCVPADAIAGALISRSDAVDLMLDDGRRARALLAADCPALDYYLGFYIKPTADGQVCAGRDAIRSRSGAVCAIRAFRRLVPAR